MKFLCLAYGDEAGWHALSEDEKNEVLAQDAAIRDGGNVISAVQRTVTSVRNWDRTLEVNSHASARHDLPLAGFSIIEADNVEEVIRLVWNTPCARARGFVDIHPLEAGQPLPRTWSLA